MKKNLFLLTICALFSLTNVMAQSHTNEHENSEHSEHSELKKFTMAISIGHTYLKTIEENDHGLNVLPTFGLDIEYWFTKKWAVGFKGDIEIATYIIEHKDNEVEIERERPMILTTPVFYKPWNNGFVFMLGPGIEIEKSENFFVTRMGVAYDMHLPHNMFVSPELVYDIKGGYINSLTAAIGIGIRL